MHEKKVENNSITRVPYRYRHCNHHRNHHRHHHHRRFSLRRQITTAEPLRPLSTV